MLLGLGFIFSGTMLTLLMLETLNHKLYRGTVTQPLLQSPSFQGESHNGGGIEPLPKHPVLVSPVRRITQLLALLSFIARSPALLLLLPTFFANSLGARVQTLLLQFVSTRFSLPLSTSSLLMPAIASINFIILMFVLPAFKKSLLFSPVRHTFYSPSPT
jgi:hypothetical protein